MTEETRNCISCRYDKCIKAGMKVLMLIVSDADDADADDAEGRYDKCIKAGMKVLKLIVFDVNDDEG